MPKKYPYSAEDIYDDFVNAILKKNKELKAISANGRTNHLVYKEVKDENGNKIKKEVITYNKFKKILSTYNKLARVKIIEGQDLDLLNGLGRLYLIMVEASSKKQVVNWGESIKLKNKLIEAGKFIKGKTKWLVYFTENRHYVVKWKKHGFIRNAGVYEFEVSGSNNGVGTFKNLIITTLKNKPFLKSLYRFIPKKQIILEDDL